MLNRRELENLIRLSSIPDAMAGFDKWLTSLCVTFNENHNYYRFLYWFIHKYKPRVILEIGTWWGIASAFMCAAANTYGGQVIGIDLNTHDLTSHILPDKYDYYFIHGDSTSKETSSVVKGLLNDGKTSKHLGLVFQDSSHHYRASCEEWEIYSELLVSNAVWICDDITPDFYNPEVDPPDKGMVQYFEERPGKKIYTDRLHKGNTMGIIFNVKQENNIR